MALSDPGIRAGLLLLVALGATAFAACAAGLEGRPGARTIRGEVRVVGNEPFTEVVVASEEGAAEGPGRADYLITGPLAGELRERLQGRTVTLEGTDCPPPSPRFRRGFRPTRILEVDEGH